MPQNQPPRHFIAIEGSDGSGKRTQTKLLADRLKRAGYEVATFALPNYGSEGCYLVERYLRGDYGADDEVEPKLAGAFFAIDRCFLRDQIGAALAAGKLVLADRFTASSLAHQGSKIESDAERADFFAWIERLEGVLNIPRPSAYLVLHVSAEVSQKLLDKRRGRAADIIEQSKRQQLRSREIYLDLCRSWPQIYKPIDCSDGRGGILNVETIHEKVWQELLKLLPEAGRPA